ncbi:MAG: alpha/beta hydrolase [bacterium]
MTTPPVARMDTPSPHRPARTFSWWRVARSLLLIYVSVLVAGWFLSDWLIFRPPPPTYHEGGAYYRVAVSATERIGMLELTNDAAPYVLLYAHGNGEDLGPDLRDYLKEYCAHGFAVYAFDYRGYGISDGRPGAGRAREDAEAAYQHLVRDRKIPPARIIVYGQSLGAALALDLAARHPVAGLVVESGFVTAFRVKTVLPLFPVDKFRNNRRMREVRCPVLILHGERDDVIPVWHGRELFRLAPEPKRAYWAPRAVHCNIRDCDEPEYWRRLQDFLKLVSRPPES